MSVWRENLSEFDHETLISTDMEGAGWRVAVHNQYRQDGILHNFWLFTHPSGFWAKGEDRHNRIALLKARGQARARMGLNG